MEQIGLINGAIRLINGKRRLKLLVGTISPVYLLCEAGRLEAVSGNALRMQYAMPIVFPLCSVPPAVARPVSCDQNSTRTCITTLNFFPSPSFDKLTRRLEDVEKTYTMFSVAATTRFDCI